ncbi:MAG: thioredoxin domain-containing protein [Thermoanaerobaculia bacterium]
MNRIPRLAALVLALALVPQFAHATKWHDTVAKAQAEAKQGNKLILVDMWADWCGWCKRMEQEVFPSEVFQASAKNYVLLKLNTEDGAEGSKVAAQFGIRSLPTFLVMTPEFTLAGKVQGYAPPEQFMAQVAQAEDEFLEYKKKLRNESKTTSDRDRLALTEDIMDRHDFVRAEPRLVALTKSTNTTIRDEAYNHLADLYAFQGKWDQAAATFKQALALNPKGEMAERNQMGLAEIYMTTKNYPAAIAELKKFKVRFPQSQMIPRVNAIIPQLERQIPGK